MHVLITGGAWTPEGEFLELPEFDMERLLVAWQEAPPEVDEMVLELDAAYCVNLIDTPVEADESQRLTYIDIDTFLASF